MGQYRAQQTGPTTFDLGIYSAGLEKARDAARRATPEQLAALTDDERALLIEQGVLLPSRSLDGSLLSMLAQAPSVTAPTPAAMPAQRQMPLDANQWLREQVIAPAAGWAGRTLGSLFGALDAPPSRSYPANAPYTSPLRMLSAANAVLPAAAGVVYDAATGRRPSRPVVDPMQPAEAQATFAGEAARRGAPSLVQLGGTLADFVVGPEHGLQGVAAAVPLAKPVGSLAKGVKATRVPGVYQLRDQVVDRLAQLYRHGLQLPTEANWEAMTDELRAAAGGRAGATQWGRLWGATSPNTAVPRNTSESLAAQLHHVERPGELMALEWAQAPGPTKITMAPSKVPNINRVYRGEPLSGDKAEAMAAFMAGDPRLPIDVHAVWALGSKGDKLQPELSDLRALMTRAEGLPARGGLTDTDIYLRYEQALRDALAQIEPARNVGGTFATMWEGTRSAKGLSHQGGPLDILKRKGLLEAGAMLDRDRLRQALSQKGWTAGAIAGLLAALPSASPDGAR